MEEPYKNYARISNELREFREFENEVRYTCDLLESNLGFGHNPGEDMTNYSEKEKEEIEKVLNERYELMVFICSKVMSLVYDAKPYDQRD